jgi:hypothetical protein
MSVLLNVAAIAVIIVRKVSPLIDGGFLGAGEKDVAVSFNAITTVEPSASPPTLFFPERLSPAPRIAGWQHWNNA